MKDLIILIATIIYFVLAGKIVALLNNYSLLNSLLILIFFILYIVVLYYVNYGIYPLLLKIITVISFFSSYICKVRKKDVK